MNSFAEFCANYGRGDLDHRLVETMKEIVRAVRETEKVGKLTLTLKVSPNGDGIVILSSDIKKLVPEPSVPDALFFTNEEGELLRRDPRQQDLPLREVPAAKGQTRQI